MSSLKETIKRLKRDSAMYRLSRMTIAKRKNIGPYEIIDLLKEGSSSKIYIAKSKYTNEIVAIKALSKSHLKNDLEGLLLIRKQIETLKILKHRNIVNLYEVYESPKYFYLITEYISGKDLIDKLIRKKRFTEEQAQRIFFQLLDALIYIHKMNICHRNLRTEHILFDSSNRPKIVGFGYSSFYESNKNIEGGYGSLCYTCPEIIDDNPYNPELADVWSLGVILYVLICGYLPFSDEDDIKNKNLISSGNIDFPKEISNKLKDLLRHMLDKNPKKRYNFQKIIKHPWIKPYSEKILTQGINIYKTIYPVDERILNIIKEYGKDQDAVKNDLIMNKFNEGTSIYKQVVKILMELKIKNISDLWSEEFAAYRDDPKNKYKDGEKRYEEFIKKVDQNYKKIEDFITDFKEREDKIVERLLYLQKLKEEEDNKKVMEEKQLNLNIIEESFDDGDEENDKEKNNKSDNEKEKEDKQRKQQNPIRLRAVKTLRNKKLKAIPRPKPKIDNPMLKFGILTRVKNKFSKLNNNIKFKKFNNLYNENIQIVYNDEKDEDVDFIKQFQEDQSKRASERIIFEKPKLQKNHSTPYLRRNKDKDNLTIMESELIKISITPEKNHEFTKQLFENIQNNDFDNDMHLEDNEAIYLTNSNTNESDLYSNFKNQNGLYSDKNFFSNNTSGNIYNQNTLKSILNKNNYSSNNNNNNNNNINNTKSSFRMTSIRKTNTNYFNNKKYLIRSSIYDEFLKKKHPDNIKKTQTTKRSLFNNVNNFNINNLKKINEGNKEKEKKGNIDDIYEDFEENNENSENSENNENSDEEKENNEKNENIGESLNIRLSLSFDDDDDDDEDENNINNEEDDIKLFNMIDNENDDEELIELKKLYYNVDDNEKENDKEKEIGLEDKKENEKEDDKENEKEIGKEDKKENEKEDDKEKENEKEKTEEKKPKGILKKIISKFDIVKSVLKKHIKFSNDKKSILRKASTRASTSSNDYTSNNSYLDDFDKYEERLKEIDKNYQIFNDKEENLEKKSSLFKRVNSKFEIMPDNIEEDINE